MFDSKAIQSGNDCTNIQLNNPSIVEGMSPDQIKDLIASITQATLTQAKRERILEKLGSTQIEHADYILVGQSGPSLQPSEVFSIVTSWDEHLQHAQQIELLYKILADGVDSVLVNQSLANAIISDPALHPLIRSIIIPACKLSLEAPITEKELKELFEVVSTIDPSIHEKQSVPFQIYLIKTILYILYSADIDRNDEELVEALQVIALHNYPLVSQFFVDAYFRISLNFMAASPVLREFVEKNADSYFTLYKDAPLTQLRNAIENPVDIYRKHQLVTVQEDLGKLAFMCRNVIEARWVVSVLYRLLPLYKTDDLDLDYDKVIEDVTSSFDDHLLSRFHYLAYTNLRSMLYIFNVTGKVSYLQKYENTYIEKSESLAWHQQIALQIEYASSIYLFLLNNGKDKLSDTKFAGLVEVDEHVPVKSILFSNILVLNDKELVEFHGGSSKGLVLKWLFSYVKRIYTLHTEKQLKINPFLLFNYRATSKVPLLRASIASLVSRSILEENSAENISDNLMYIGRVISLIEYSRTSRMFDCEQLCDWVEAGLRANRYSVLLNAKAFAYIIYHLTYYCESQNLERLSGLVVKFYNLVHFPEKPLRLYQAVLACQSLSENEKELEYVLSLYEAMKEANPKLFQLSLRSGEEFNLTIPDSAIEILRHFDDRGSSLAKVGNEYILVPEYWNLMATTIFNIGYPNKEKSYGIAAMFYSISKCFAREQKNNDQKFSFNYIRAQSLFYLTSNKPPSDFFVRDTSYYIHRPNNQYFSFKKACCEPFFSLLRLHYDDIPKDVDELYREQILPKHHWVKEEFFKQKIGVFSKEIRIT